MDRGPKRVYIRREVELVRYGFTPGCPGCDAARDGGEPKNHTQVCRNRIEQEMAKDSALAQRLDQARERGAPAHSDMEVQANAEEQSRDSYPSKPDVEMSASAASSMNPRGN